VTPARRLATLIILGAAVLALALIVLVTARRVEEHLLAVVGILGGLAIVVVSLPVDRPK
jgi:hypothetical protein